MTKLTLTSDLIKRETNRNKKEQLNLKIDKELKKAFQIWCVNSDVSMSLKLEEMIKQCIER
jgi:hypothetical protein